MPVEHSFACQFMLFSFAAAATDSCQWGRSPARANQSHNAVWAWALKRLEEAHCKLQTAADVVVYDDGLWLWCQWASNALHKLYECTPLCYMVSVVCVLWYMMVSPSTQAACIINPIVVSLLLLLLLLHAPVSGNIKAKCPKINWDLGIAKGPRRSLHFVFIFYDLQLKLSRGS